MAGPRSTDAIGYAFQEVRDRTDREVEALQAIGRTRALTDAESLRLERLLTSQDNRARRAHRDALAKRRAARMAA